MCPFFFLLVIFATASCKPSIQPYFDHPDEGLNVLELITKYGYPVEQHDVETKDGYVLQLHRIPHGKNNANETSKPPVFIMHGIVASSADWVNAVNEGKSRSLAYELADLGYDVWMGNARGNTWSRKHKTLDPDADLQGFWNFSFHEVGIYDLTASIDHVLKINGQEKLFYIGHSQGTTTFFVMASERPEYNDKIRLMSALAPVAYSNHMKNLLSQIIARFEQPIHNILKFLKIYELASSKEWFHKLSKTLCDVDAPFHEVCAAIAFLIAGDDDEQLNREMLPVVLSNFPAGSSTKQFMHYAQGVRTGNFSKFDHHSAAKNIEEYGQEFPPHYDLSKVTAPVALYYGKNDWLVSPKDVEHTRNELGNVVVDNLLPHEKFSHLDFIWATDVYELLYKDVIENMRNY